MTIPTVVELRTAFHWFCENCGRANFSLPQKMEFAPGEREAVFRELQEWDEAEPLPDGWEEFDMLEMPERVTCEFCGESFDAVPEQEA